MKISHTAILALAFPLSLAAQQPAGPTPNPITAAFRGRITGLHRNIAQAFDSIPESKFGYKPTPAQLTIGYIAQHVASDDYLFCTKFGPLQPTLSAEDTTTADSVKAQWPKDKLVSKLKESLKYCDDAIAQLDDAKLAEQTSITFGGQSRPTTRACDGARPRAGHVGSLQPARELHAAERDHSAVGAASAGPRRELAEESTARPERRPLRSCSSPLRGDRPQPIAQRLDILPRPVPAIRDDARNRTRVRDVVERIRPQDHEIRDVSRFERSRTAPPDSLPRKRAGLIVAVCSASSGVKPAATKRCSSKCRLMPGVTSTPAGVSVPARNGTPAAWSFRTMSNSCWTNRRRTSSGSVSMLPSDRLPHRRILLVDPRARRVREVRILRVVDHVDEPLSPLPEQRRALPGLVLGEQLDDARFARGFVAVEQDRQALVGRRVLSGAVLAA